MSTPRRRRVAGLHLFPLLWLTGVWVLLWGTWSLGNVLNGLMLAAVVLLLLPLPDVGFGGRVSPRGLLAFVGHFVRDLLLSSVQVAWQAVRPGEQDTSSVVAIQLRSDSELLMTMTAEALTLVPGSIVIEVDARHRTIYAHVLSAPDDATVETFRRRVLDLEARVVRAIGRSEDRELLLPPAGGPA